jgi:two-component system, OmpR family, sensor histidine kinase CpxA
VKGGVPLYVQVLICALLNALLVLAAMFVLLPERMGIGWVPLLSERERDRLQSIGEAIAAEVWPVLNGTFRVDLERYDTLYGVRFSVFEGAGVRLAGPQDLVLPVGVAQEVRRTPVLMLREAPPASANAAPPVIPSKLPGWPYPDREVLKQRMFVLREYGRYWIGIRTPIPLVDGQLVPATIVASTPSFWRFIRFLDLKEWVNGCLFVLTMSMLLWLPLVWSLTRAVTRVTTAAERIADGHFEARVRLRRRDELGRLGRVVDTVAERLDSFLSSQKHFLANIAHEVASPLGRLQAGLEILARHVDDKGQEAYQDVHEEVQLMAELVEELLAFSRLGIGEKRLQMTTLSLHALSLSVLDRENAGGKVLMSVPPDLQVRANAAVLGRAIGNLIRNALRYAGTGRGMIELSAEASGKTVLVLVRDRGPGVPELALLKLGDAFYRPELARRRETGGLGLGLATVKNCVAACGGTVSFRNREGGGFEAEITLPRVVS